MLIELKKFGATLTSRDDGREDYSAMQSVFKNINADEAVEIDFRGVNTFTPSWGDEFITPLFKNFNGRLILKHLENPSVRKTLSIIEKVNAINFKRE